MTDPDRIPIAYVRRAHGIRGDVVIRGLGADAPDRLAPGSTLEVDAGGAHFVIGSSKSHGTDFLVHLEGIDDRTAAETLVGTQFTIDHADRRALDEEEYWIDEILGCVVVDISGNVIGSVVDVAVGSAQDRLVVEVEAGGRAEVPLVAELVPVVDTAERRIVVDPPPGLLDQAAAD